MSDDNSEKNSKFDLNKDGKIGVQDLKRIFEKITAPRVFISLIISLGFLALIISSSYATSADYTNAPDAPKT
ncbi:MAG: hypothetical protein QF479_04125, partial [Candidatus Poseidoniaceae archaeon]|nr:hypothetical protein [Candidatus Poseidoniaceae archaeon]